MPGVLPGDLPVFLGISSDGSGRHCGQKVRPSERSLPWSSPEVSTHQPRMTFAERGLFTTIPRSADNATMAARRSRTTLTADERDGIILAVNRAFRKLKNLHSNIVLVSKTSGGVA